VNPTEVREAAKRAIAAIRVRPDQPPENMLAAPPTNVLAVMEIRRELELEDGYQVSGTEGVRMILMPFVSKHEHCPTAICDSGHGHYDNCSGGCVVKAAMIIARVVACLLGAALASEEPAAQPSGGPTDQQQTTIARKTPELQAIERLNTWVVGLAGGQLEGAPIRFGTEAARVVDDGDNLCVLPIVTRGPVENVEALL
jgi:hypothetical protein